MYDHRPINHGSATAFKSYRVTLNTRLPPRSYHLNFERIRHLFHCVSINKGDNFIHRDNRPINIIISFSVVIYTSHLMCAAIIAYIPFIFVINKNILNRRAPAPSHSNPVDFMTPIIFRVCVWSCIIS